MRTSVMPRFRSQRLLPTATGLAAMLALAAGGCGDDAGRDAIEASRIDVRTVASGQGVGAEVADYQALISTLSERAGDLDGGAEQAMGVLLGAARSGRASELNEAAVLSEFDLAERVHVLRGHVARWSRLAAQSEAASRVNVSDEVRELLEQERARTTEAEAQAERAAELAARAADLQAQIDDLRAQALEQRSLAGELELTLPTTPAVQAPGVAARVRAHLLRSDELDAESQRVEMARGQVMPELREAELRTAQLREQARLLSVAQRDAQERQRRAEEDTRRTATAAAAAAESIETLLAALENARTGEFDQRFSAAARELQQAATEARKARDVAAGSGAIGNGAANQVLGGLHLRRSLALLEVARLHEYIAEVGVPVATDAAGIESDAESAHQAGVDAYGAAANAYRGSRIRGDVGQRLTELADLLDRMAQTPLGGVPSLAMPVPDAEGFENTDNADAFDDQMPDEGIDATEGDAAGDAQDD
ncbi:MAG: hypothetical protein AAF995_02975 [Planctomycetota bacterium]